jgi:DNA-binding FadR family transcriptional regulator
MKVWYPILTFLGAFMTALTVQDHELRARRIHLGGTLRAMKGRRIDTVIEVIYTLSYKNRSKPRLLMQIPRDDIFMVTHNHNPLEEATERIAGAIKARLLSPGDRLPSERELALQLGVSRSTLRGALQNLIDTGWLEVRRGRLGGSFVARWPVMPHPGQMPEVLTRYSSELPSLLDYRRAVESTAAACAAERALHKEIIDLEALNDKFEECLFDFETYRAIDTRFHIGIARAAHSSRLMKAVTEVQAELTEVLDVIIYHSREALREVAKSHRHILDAIRDQDSEAARRFMLDHLAATENVIYELGAPIMQKKRMVGEALHC